MAHLNSKLLVISKINVKNKMKENQKKQAT